MAMRLIDGAWLAAESPGIIRDELKFVVLEGILL